jgi:SAM-dependent methyltransferase
MDLERIPFERCPLCEATDSFLELTADCSRHPSYREPLPKLMRWRRCRACDHSYVDGYLSQAAADLLFSGSLPHQTPRQALETARHTAAAMVEKVCALRDQQGGRWLDIGFGNGALMTTAAEFGFEAVGLDLRKANVDLMRSFGFEAHALSFEDYRPDQPFDVISMADVLEHMPFPKVGLQHARELLRPDGILLVSMPNSDSFLWQALTKQTANPYWGELEHFHNFGRRRLYALLREFGFEPLRYGVSSRYRICMEILARRGPG